MIKTRAKNQIGNLILDHESFQSKGQKIANWGMQYTIGNIFLRIIKYYVCMLQKIQFEENMNI